MLVTETVYGSRILDKEWWRWPLDCCYSFLVGCINSWVGPRMEEGRFVFSSPALWLSYKYLGQEGPSIKRKFASGASNSPVISG